MAFAAGFRVEQHTAGVAEIVISETKRYHIPAVSSMHIRCFSFYKFLTFVLAGIGTTFKEKASGQPTPVESRKAYMEHTNYWLSPPSSGIFTRLPKSCFTK